MYGDGHAILEQGFIKPVGNRQLTVVQTDTMTYASACFLVDSVFSQLFAHRPGDQCHRHTWLHFRSPGVRRCTGYRVEVCQLFYRA